MRFSHSVSLSFLVYSRLCTRPQTRTLVPTSKLEANRALLSPADAGYVIGFAVGAVHRQKNICDFPAQEESSGKWAALQI